MRLCSARRSRSRSGSSSLLELLPARGELARGTAVLGAAPPCISRSTSATSCALVLSTSACLGRVRQRRGHQPDASFPSAASSSGAPALELVRQRGRGGERIAHARALRDPALRRGFEARTRRRLALDVGPADVRRRVRGGSIARVDRSSGRALKNAASRSGLGRSGRARRGSPRPAAPERKHAPTPSLPAAHPACAARRRTGWCDEEARANVRGSNDKDDLDVPTTRQRKSVGHHLRRKTRQNVENRHEVLG